MTLSLTNQGFDYVSYYNGAYENANSLDALAQTGANSIEASLDYGIDPQTSEVYADSSATDSLAALGATIAQATALGLSVMVRPLIDFVDQGDLNGTPYSYDEWRTYYNPGPAGSATANAFFASYQTMILQEAQVAVANGATSLCIGTELDQITGPAYKSYWDSIITALRTDDPSLKLTYAADWDDDLSPWQWGGTGLAAGTGDLATQVSFAGELDSIGVDCYAPISDAANPTLAQLIAGWTQRPTDPQTLAVTGGQSLISYFESISTAVGKPLLFTELGYENATDAASQPAGSSTNVVDSKLQAELYQAFFEAWRQSGNSSLTGVYFWNWDPNSAEVGPGEGTNFSPQGLPAQGVATDWFGPGPATTFKAPTFGARDAIILTGTATDSAGVQSVELFDGAKDLGAATLDAASGAWSFSAALPAGVYTFTALATDHDGKQSTGLASFVVATGLQGHPYSASVSDYDSNGALTGRSFYQTDGDLYLGWTVAKVGGDFVQDIDRGDYFANRGYHALIDTYDSSGELVPADLLSQTYDMNNGSHILRGYADGLTFDSLRNDTMTGGGDSETFVFNPGFGADKVTDFAAHLTGAGADRISVATSQFADFSALLAATRNSGANVVITAPNHDTITLFDMTRRLVAAHSGDFSFHA
jgi:hypothetical protein